MHQVRGQRVKHSALLTNDGKQSCGITQCLRPARWLRLASAWPHLRFFGVAEIPAPHTRAYGIEAIGPLVSPRKNERHLPSGWQTLGAWMSGRLLAYITTFDPS